MSLPIVYIDEVSSTNDYLQELVKTVDNLNEGLVVCAKNQTRGKGQIGNSWVSEPGQNLTFSLLLRPTFLMPTYQFCLSQAVSLAVYQTLVEQVDETEAVHFSIKWPNDIYYKEKKIAGILIENQILGKTISHSIIGIGVNINQLVFPEGIPNPVSLRNITHVAYPLEKILQRMQENLMNLYHELSEQGATSIQFAYHQHLFRKGKTFEFSDGKERFLASILHVSDDGKITLQLATGEMRRYYFKEVYFTDLRN